LGLRKSLRTTQEITSGGAKQDGSVPIDSEHGTSAWLTIVRECVGQKNASRMRDLLVELNAPREYYEAIEPPMTGKVRNQARDLAIVETLTTFYGGVGAAGLARDWSDYVHRTYRFDKAKPSRLAAALPLRQALYRLTQLNGGDSLRARQISRAPGNVHLGPTIADT
jgi:hypothetical protein